MRVKDLSDCLGYGDVEQFLKDHGDLVILPVVGNTKIHPKHIENSGYVSSLSAFRRLGHRIVHRGRPVFDDYSETEATEKGFKDNTLWAAAQGKLTLPCLIELLQQTAEPDFKDLDSTSQSTLDYMKSFQRRPGARFSPDPVSILLWKQALSSSSSEEAEQLLRELADLNMEVSVRGESDDLRAGNLQPLISSMNFCSAVGALGEQQHRFFSGVSETGAKDPSTCQIFFCQWEAPQLLRNLLQHQKGCTVQEIIGRQVTVAGSNGSFDCCDCASFATKHWRGSGRRALSLISTIIEQLLDGKGSDTVEGTMKYLGNGYTDLSYVATDSHLAVSLVASVNRMRQLSLGSLFEALSWICCAMRPGVVPASPGRQLRSFKICKELLVSQPFRRQIFYQRRNFVFVKLQPLVEKSAESSSLCWTHLFSFIPVVKTDIIRTWGRGLEIPFSLMVELSAVENVCTFDGRIALLGYFTALIPTDEDEDLGRIQWHLEVVEASEETLLPSTLQQRLRGKRWVKIDPQEMHKKTCFLGWSSNANVMLGTKALVERQGMLRSPNNLEVARSHLERDTVEAGFQISLGIPGIDPILKGSKAWKRQDNTITRSPVSDYRLSLNLARRKTCFLVNTQSKQAWLVPVLSVVFHLCHLFYRMNKIGDEQTPLPFAEPSCDGDRAVLEVISHSHDLEVLGSRFSALFHQQYCNLVDHPRRTTSSFFYANDLVHSLENKRTFPRKVPVRDDGFSWPDLLPFATGADAIAVGANIGQILQPLSNTGKRLCSCNDLSCAKLPIGRCYLAAHVRSLQQIFNVDEITSGNRCKFMLSETLWIVKGDPCGLAQCDGSSIWESAAVMCGLLQETQPNKAKLVKARNGHLRNDMVLLKEIPSNGVVVFGRRSAC